MFHVTVSQTTVTHLKGSVQKFSTQQFRVPVVLIVTDQTVGPISSCFSQPPEYIRDDIVLDSTRLERDKGIGSVKPIQPGMKTTAAADVAGRVGFARPMLFFLYLFRLSKSVLNNVGWPLNLGAPKI